MIITAFQIELLKDIAIFTQCHIKVKQIDIENWLIYDINGNTYQVLTNTQYVNQLDELIHEKQLVEFYQGITKYHILTKSQKGNSDSI